MARDKIEKMIHRILLMIPFVLKIPNSLICHERMARAMIQRWRKTMLINWVSITGWNEYQNTQPTSARQAKK